MQLLWLINRLAQYEMERLRKVFKKDKIEVKSEGYLNNLELRFPNEPARHKLLDVVGDLALVGYPIKAKIIANRPGHSSNVEFAKKIKQYIKKTKHTVVFRFMIQHGRQFLILHTLKKNYPTVIHFYCWIRSLN